MGELLECFCCLCECCCDIFERQICNALCGEDLEEEQQDVGQHCYEPEEQLEDVVTEQPYTISDGVLEEQPPEYEEALGLG